jgi:hypothetical protein
LSNSWKMLLLTFSSSTTASTIKSACFMPCRGQCSTAQGAGNRSTGQEGSQESSCSPGAECGRCVHAADTICCYVPLAGTMWRFPARQLHCPSTLAPHRLAAGASTKAPAQQLTSMVVSVRMRPIASSAASFVTCGATNTCSMGTAAAGQMCQQPLSCKTHRQELKGTTLCGASTV